MELTCPCRYRHLMATLGAMMPHISPTNIPPAAKFEKNIPAFSPLI